MPSAMTLQGHVFNDSGTALQDVEVKVFQKNTTATALATDTSDANGRWDLSWTPSDSNTTQVDVQGTSGTSVFRWKYDDRIAVSGAIIGDLRLTPSHNFSFIFDGTPTADRTITFSDNAGTVALLGAAQTFSAAQTFTNTVTVGVDDDGKDVKFYGETSGQYMLWDESADELVLAGDTKLSFHDAAGGENIIASANGHLEINSGTTLDVTAPTVDINASSAVTVDSAGISLDGSAASNFTTSGGALTLTSAAAATWSTAAGALTVNGTAGINLQEGGSTIISISDARVLATSNTASVDLDATGAIQVNSSGGAISIANDNVDQTVNLATAGTRTLNIGIGDGTDITTTVMKGTVSVGVDDAGYDVTFFGDTASRYWLWDTSADGVVQRGTLTVGVDDAGHDVKFFGDTASAYMLWDTSADDLILGGAAGLVLGSGGIVFPDASAAGSASGNTLDEFEEGTFDPLLGDGTTELTSNYSNNDGTNPTDHGLGRYTKIGSRVFFSITIRNTNLGALTDTAQLRIVNLPFASSAVALSRSAIYVGGASSLNLDAANQTVTGIVNEDGDIITFSVWDATDRVNDMKVSELSASGLLTLSGHYTAAS